MNPKVIDSFLKHLPKLAWLLISISAGLILYFILRYGVDVPYMDQWEYVGFFDNFHKGTLTFEELFAQQSEYRQLFPNLIFVGLGILTRWDVRYEMIVTFLLACLTFFNIYRMSVFTVKDNKVMRAVLLFVASLFVFAPIQYENWLFGVQIEYLLPVACITGCVAITLSGIKNHWKLILSMLLAVISTYSSINGLLCWFVPLPVMLFSGNSASYFKRWPVLTAWMGAAILTITY